MKKYGYEVTVTLTGTFDMEDDEASEYDEDELRDYACDLALDALSPGVKPDVDDVDLWEISLV